MLIKKIKKDAIEKHLIISWFGEESGNDVMYAQLCQKPFASCETEGAT